LELLKRVGLFTASKNWAVALKMERFNCSVYLCAAVGLFIQEDVHAYLQEFYHITNTLVCIARSFASMVFLSIFCGVRAAIDVYLIQPYLNITYFDPMSYSKS